MNSNYLTPIRPTPIAVPAIRYNYEQLADIYNRARVDYIVPMPMNGKRMMEYIQHYSINLEASAVALLSTKQGRDSVSDDSAVDNAVNASEIGLMMIGLRNGRAWATRLGIVPDYRGYKIGQFLMETLIERAVDFHLRLVQLEVIKGNEPAYRLFVKLGFVPTRELLVIRRPPGIPSPALIPSDVQITAIPPSELAAYLAQREPIAAWTEETESLLNAGHLQGFTLQLPSGEQGWIIFQRLPFQLTHFVLSPAASLPMMQALLYTVHAQNTMQDTKIENVPADHPLWTAYQQVGYIEVFRRVEMILTL